jgi:predicted DNA-binding protein (MmcQ/YjbR family)
MSIESDIFTRKRVKPEALSAYGFKREGSLWHYEETLPGGDFYARITVDGRGTLEGKVFEKETGEEYLPVHVESFIGAFVGEIRLAYTKILEKIAESCFEEQCFAMSQTNRLAALILDKYGEAPDHPFAKAPECGVFRYPPNRKWYGLVMYIRKELLSGEKDNEASAGQLVEIMNLKLGEERIADALKRPGIYPSYHMKQTNWVSVLLDDTLSDDEVMELIAISREFAVSSGKKRQNRARAWIVPANPKYYDVEAAFAENEEIIWKQGRGIMPGDTVYLYLAAPVSAVLYRCKVTETNIPLFKSDENITMTHAMRIRREKIYPPELFTFERLKALGVRAVRGPRPATQELLSELEKA